MTWLRLLWLCVTRPAQVLLALFLVLLWIASLDLLLGTPRRRVVRGRGFTMRDP
jgi:hypothetical protein